MNKNVKIISIVFFILAILILLPVLFVFYGIPLIVQNPNFLSWVQDYVDKNYNADLIINSPALNISKDLTITFKSNEVLLIKDGNTYLSAKNLDSVISLKKILEKKIILRKLGADDLFIDINNLQKLTFKDQEQEQKPFEYKILWFKSDMYLKKCMILYRAPNNVLIKLLARDLELTKEINPKYVHFSILTDIEYDNQRFRMLFKDFNTIYFKDKKINIDNFKFIVDKTMISVNGYLDEKNNYKLNVKSNKFKVQSVKSILESNLIIPNGKEVLSCFKDLGGTFNFNINLSNKDLNGDVDINKVNLKLIPLANIPITLTKGKIKLNKNDIKISNVNGYYGSKITNKFECFGDVKDYTKTAKTEIGIRGIVESEFSKYLSKVANCNLLLKGNSQFAMKVNYDTTGKVVVIGSTKIPKGSDFLVENSSISSSKFDRALGFKLNILKNDLNIEHLNYYISDFISTKGKPVFKPLVTMNSKVDLASGWLKELSFDIPEPLPSEFFNALINQNLLRGGTFSGKIKYNNYDTKNPKVEGKMTLDDVRVRGQGLSVKHGVLTTTNNDINIKADGRLRRVEYKIDGDIKNRILFPIIVKNVNVDIDEIDVERLMQTFAPRKPLTEEERKKLQERMAQMKFARSDVSTKYFEVEQSSIEKKNEATQEEPIKFVPNLFAIKNCRFNVKKGQYKLLNFANLNADLSLTEKGILEIKSNRFDFAEGISSLKVYCDMAKELYSVKLGAKDVNSDLISTSILNLPKEISGKTNALLEFNTDKNMKLNGNIKFSVNNGAISKLGLVQYILNVAAIFRNPIVMISPTTLFDMINVPDGSFKKISGKLEIKDNIVERMMIQSSSPQLSAFIVGKINLENFDSSLRIYTKFSNKNKGISGFLRNISINMLTKKAVINAEEVSYYASELSMLPKLETGEETAQVFLTKVDGDVQTNNFISSLKKIK
ncbi:hypothetical protein IJG72_06790 [bacterium]|nr:hypothetical protein [bacterium]